jgi:hypothetical protein
MGLGSLFFVLNSILFGGHNLSLFVAFFVCISGGIVGLGTIYYKNVSFVIAQRLLKEVNVVMILLSGLCLFAVDFFRRNHTIISPIYGFIYFVGLCLFVSLDAVKKKSRVFVLVIGSLFAFLTLWNIYDRTFNGTDVGVILFQYGDDYVFYKRSTKRSCFIQILLFSLNGIWTMIKDKKMEMMIFATGNIYRETGTASKYVEDIEHAMRSETAESMV